MIAGITVGVLLAIIAIVVIGVVVYKRRQQNKNGYPHPVRV